MSVRLKIRLQKGVFARSLQAHRVLCMGGTKLGDLDFVRDFQQRLELVLNLNSFLLHLQGARSQDLCLAGGRRDFHVVDEQRRKNGIRREFGDGGDGLGHALELQVNFVKVEDQLAVRRGQRLCLQLLASIIPRSLSETRNKTHFSSYV